MSKFFLPTGGPESWAGALAEPTLHLKRGRSAWELAHRWEVADGFPREVSDVLSSSHAPELVDIEFAAGFPEFKTPLPGGSRPSQTDLLVLARNGSGRLVVIGVEGKVDEPFGPRVDEWLLHASTGKQKRLACITSRLGLTSEDVGSLRYQLLHRTVAAGIEAERFGGVAAVMLVHSFDPSAAGFNDYQAFISVMGGEARIGELTLLRRHTAMPTYAGWALGPTANFADPG